MTKLRSQIPDNSSDPLAILRESMASRECSMRFKPVKPGEVLKIMLGLKNSKSSGIDNINTAVLKLVAKDILPAVTHIINQSLSQSSFPTIWKHSKVIPLLKSWLIDFIWLNGTLLIIRTHNVISYLIH